MASGDLGEFDESELFGGADVDREDTVESGSDQDGEEEQDTFDITAGLGANLETGDGSAKSETTLGVVIAGSEQQFGGSGRWNKPRAVPRPVMASSMPVNMLGGIKMGSSVPIAIAPGRRPTQEARDPEVSTFIPPHKLSQRDYTFSFAGESPGTIVKRDRLRVRNAILQSTGFLENKGSTTTSVAVASSLVLGGMSGGFPTTGLPPASPGGSQIERMSSRQLGGLSQALHAVGSPAAS